MPGRQWWKGPDPVFSMDPHSWVFEVMTAEPVGVKEELGSDHELADLLTWAVRAGVVGRDEARLLVELVAADRENASFASPQWNRGACSVAAAAEVARQRGVCRKTIFRARDSAISRLREAAPRYLAEVA
jgi:hypothetical protein